MNPVAPSTDQLLADLRRIVTDSEALLHATRDAAGDQAHEVRERLGAALEAAKRSCHQLEDKARAGVRAADQTIREHPYQSIGLAFGLGLLLGVLAARK